MSIGGKKNSYRNISKKYLLFIPVFAVVVMSLYAAFFMAGRIFLDSRMADELNRECEKGAYDIERHIEGYMMSLVSAAGFIRDEDYSYCLSRLKESQSYIRCSMLGILDKDGTFYTTDNRRLGMGGYECFADVLDGNLVKGRSFEYGGEVYILYGVPLYSGNTVTGALCCCELMSDLSGMVESSDYFTFIFAVNDGRILTEKGKLGDFGERLPDILSENNMIRFNAAAREDKNALLMDKLDGKDIRYYVYPLESNNGVLLSAITDEDYNRLTGNFFVGTFALYIVFFIIIVFIIVSAVIYVRMANKSLIEQLERFSMASSTLKIGFIIHSSESPGLISYKSTSLGKILGYNDNEIELIFKNRLESLIYSEDRNRAMRDFEDFFASGDSVGKIYLRLVAKNREPIRFADNMFKDRKTGQIVSIISPVDNVARAYEENEYMTKRLELLAEVSSCYVFELNVSEKRLFLSENLKERLGYTLQAEDCFRQSVRNKLISPHSRKELEAMIRSYKRGNRSITGGITVMTSMGSYVRFKVRAEIIGSVIKDEVRVLAVLSEI